MNIYATITDNIEVAYVYLNITYPNSQTQNFSITQNKAGDVYNYNTTYSTIGTHTIFIGARDARNNWATSSSSTFEVHEGTAPTIVDN